MREQKGITLIALVITIIILLILAGVTIAALTGDNGLLNRATTTRETNAEAEARELSNLAYMTVRTEIAAKSVESGTYRPATEVADLATVCVDTLDATTITQAASATAGWSVMSDSTQAATNGKSTITLIYKNDAINNNTHTLTYTITVANATTTGTGGIDTGFEENTASLTGPSEGYNRIATDTED